MFGRGADVMQKGAASSSTAQPAAAAAAPPPLPLRCALTHKFFSFFSIFLSGLIRQ